MALHWPDAGMLEAGTGFHSLKAYMPTSDVKVTLERHHTPETGAPTDTGRTLMNSAVPPATLFNIVWGISRGGVAS